MNGAVNRQNGKVDWNKIQDEVTDGNGIVYTRVMIDLGRVLKAIYGNKDESGKGNYLYNIMVGKPINAVRSPSGMLLEDRCLLQMKGCLKTHLCLFPPESTYHHL